MPSGEFLKTLSEKGINVDWLLTGKGPVYSIVGLTDTGEKADTKSIPILTRCPAGPPQSWVIEESYLDEHVPYLHDLIPYSPEMFCLRITGDSMCPIVQPGDVALVDLARQWQEGDIVVAWFNGEEQTCKYIESQGSIIRLLPANPSYNVQEVSNRSVEWIGKVVGIYREDPRGKNGQGSIHLVKALQNDLVGQLAVLLAEMPEEFLEALRAALAKAPPQPERQNIYRLATWMLQICARAQEEIGKLLNI